MTFELPELFKPRILIAIALGALTEWGLGNLTGVNPSFSMKSFIVFALFFIVVGWIGEKIYQRLTRKKSDPAGAEEARAIIESELSPLGGAARVPPTEK